MNVCSRWAPHPFEARVMADLHGVGIADHVVMKTMQPSVEHDAAGLVEELFSSVALPPDFSSAASYWPSIIVRWPRPSVVRPPAACLSRRKGAEIPAT